MTKKAKLPTDVNSRAKAIVDFATSDETMPEKDEARAAGGSKGGKARSEQLTSEHRMAS